MYFKGSACCWGSEVRIAAPETEEGAPGARRTALARAQQPCSSGSKVKKHKSLFGDSTQQETETVFQTLGSPTFFSPGFPLNDRCGVTFLSTCEKSEQSLVKHRSSVSRSTQKLWRNPKSWHEALVLPHHRMCRQTSSTSLRLANIPGVLSPESRAAICPRNDKMAQFFPGLSRDLQSWY